MPECGKTSACWKESRGQGKNGRQLALTSAPNNYLGLASSELAQAAVHGIKKSALAKLPSVLLWVRSTIIKDLEKEISKIFWHEEYAITYTSCFDANTGLFETILKEGEMRFFSDELTTHSIIEQRKILQGEKRILVLKIPNMEDLENKLDDGRRRRKLIATDSISSSWTRRIYR